jgi:hypothetical protein
MIAFTNKAWIREYSDSFTRESRGKMSKGKIGQGLKKVKEGYLTFQRSIF